jgi:predicted AAA+ superfamily ATPase
MNAEPFRNWRFHTLDDFGTLEQAHSNPNSLWAGTTQVVLDEVQKAPELLLAVKKAVDQSPGKFQFGLSGSVNLLLMKQVSESLAGRVNRFTQSCRIHPARIHAPLLLLESSQSWTRWWDGYVATYLERDLRQVAQIDALLDFRRAMELAALRSGQLINQSELARDARLTQPTTHRYLNLL